MTEPAAAPPRSSRVRRWALRLLALAALFVACNTGGVAATTLFPTRVDTLNYGADLRLSLNPADINLIQSPTIFGDIRMEFAGLPAPGVVAHVHVKERITELLSRRNVTVKSLEPGPLELENAAKTAAVGLGARFAGGALAVGLLALGAYAVWRRGWRGPGLRAAAGALRGPAWVVSGAYLASVLATFGVIGLTYTPDRLESFRTTGILGTVQRNADLLEGVETRAEQTAPYLKNLLALSAALQEKYSPQQLGRPVAARFLLVSDIHGANQYSLMRTIVQEERIDAVIDAGDLVNFGTATEARTAGIFRGIESLGVPYLFVKGNHDARSDVDREVIAALAKVPNVVLLQPDEQTYVIESIAGLRIAGFNDPRWFGDDNKNNAAKQKPATRRYLDTMEGRPAPDVVVSHEPAAVEDVEGPGIRVNGHMHTAQLKGNRIGVGTFTGGGPFSHFVAEGNEEGEELTGQPSAFDVMAFGEDCRLLSLTRYQFRNVVEGRPAYDDVTLINGARIEGEVPPAAGPDDEGSASTATATGAPTARTCSADEERSTETVQAAAP